MRAFLSRWLGSKKVCNASHLTVTVYTRDGCSCCHKAVDVLKEFRRRYRFEIEEVDVDTDPALVSAYGTTVPVVAFAGKVRFKGVVNPVLLERLLLAESRVKD